MSDLVRAAGAGARRRRTVSLTGLGASGLAPLSLRLAGAPVDVDPTRMFAAGGVRLAAVAAGLLSRAHRRLD
jgi:hypothetical protein